MESSPRGSPVDQNIGKLIARQQAGQLDNTLILFSRQRRLR
jgi:hypothetical protein